MASRIFEAAALGLLVVTPLLMNVAGVRTFEAMKLAGALPLAAFMAFGLITLIWRGQKPAQRGPVFWAFGAWIFSAIAATVLSELPWIAFYGEYFRREGLLSWLVYAAMFIGLLATLEERIQVERVIDAVLIASVAPCAYAIMQRFGFDFFETGGLGAGETSARPGANLGNPTFLSAYLLIVIPLTLARAANALKSRSLRAGFLALGLAQFYAVILTQSRGPLLGLVVTLFLFAVTGGARLRNKNLMWGAATFACLAVAALAAVNMSAAAQSAAQGTPLQRFVIAGGPDLTSLSRVGIWQAGVEAFHQLPAWRQLIGSGPDTAYVNYFAHLSPTVLRIEGYAETIDRLHSETMESIMTLGIVGWVAQVIFFSSLIWTVATRCAAWSGWRPAFLFAGTCVTISTLAGIVAVRFGNSLAFFPIGCGVGIGIAWSVTMFQAGLRMFSRLTPSTREQDDLLLLAMCCAVIGSWIESQVGVPTITTRLMLATYAALILSIVSKKFETTSIATPSNLSNPSSAALPSPAQRRKKNKPKVVEHANRIQRSSLPAYAGWLTSLALIVCTAGYFPPLLGNAIHAPAVHKLHLILIPLVALVVAGAGLAWHEAKRTGTPAMDAMPRFLLWFSIPWVLFVLAYVDMGRAIPVASQLQAGDRINELLMLAFGSPAVMVVLRVLSSGTDRHRRHASYLWLVAAIATSMAVLWAAMLDVRADTYMKLANWAHQKGNFDTQSNYLQKATLIAPFERRYSSAYAASLIDQSAQALSRSQGPAAALQETLKKLVTAEQHTRQSLRLSPRDPWMNYAHANAHQFMALGFFSPFQPDGEREHHIQTARHYFANAHAQFPAHPWILRNWAQLEYELGNKAAAYAKFDQMEKLDPLNISVYTDRARIATVAGDDQIAIASLEQGVANQPTGSTAQMQLKADLAKAHMQLGNVQRALLIWGEIVRADPLNHDAAIGMIEAYALVGQRESALNMAQGVLAQLRSMPATRQNRSTKVKIEALAAQIAGSLRKR